MPTRRIGDIPKDGNWVKQDHCESAHMFFEPGEWEHVCPQCGARQLFYVHGVRY